MRVVGTKPGYKGVTKAVRVVPEEPQAPAIARKQVVVARRQVAWADVVRDHPRWSDAEEVSLPFPDAIAPLVLSAHPLWSPWQEELALVTDE